MDDTAYFWLKALHIVAIIAWMAGLLYLPRLFVYHAQAEAGSELSETLKIMERRLLRAIMNPAMVVSLFAGGLLLMYQDFSSGWLHVKLVCVVGLLVMHMMMGKWRKDFEADRNTRGHKFYRIANEFPTVLMIVIVIMAVVKPF
ncbi:MAG: protoporphyrinogen oxidase HemJ [Rhodospirillales bacterium]|nr:protoporphyrinogen oxidase HemJ [Rhodospirillales bacterium]MBO6787628.1 protoporphyrinogen oxidase HemJ [Rhodospirillales bacterium]